jgi:VanZ family protein
VTGLLLLAIALIVYGSLYPWQFDFSRHVNPLFLLLHSWPNGWDRFVLRDVAINVLLYVPVGALAVLSLRTRRRPRLAAVLAAVALGAALSAGMELLQAYDDHRDTSLLDWTTNTSGTLAGALLAMVFEPAVRSVQRLRGGPRHLRASAAILMACWAGFQFYPLFPDITTTRLRAALALLAHSPHAGVVEIWAGTAEWFAVALALDAFLGRFRTAWLAALMMAIPARIFIVTRSVTWNDLLGAVAALGLWAAIPAFWRVRAALCMLLSALLLRELAPFHFADYPAAFSWIPFSATLDSERQTAIVILLRKAFDYGAAVWLLRRAGWPYARAGACLAAALLGLELLQRYLPGRTPESTDPVLALLMALALWLPDRGP